MKKFNESVFLQDLALIDWSLILQNGTDLNEQVGNWCEVLSMIIDNNPKLLVFLLSRMVTKILLTLNKLPTL